MSQRVLLPIQQPHVVGYAHHAFPLSIPCANPEQFADWNAGQWIQICCPPDFPENRDTHFDFYINRYYHGYFWLESRKVLKESVSDVVEFAIKSLNRGSYVVLYVDEYYIPDRASFHKQHHGHELMLFGYDEEKQEFDVLGYSQREIYSDSKVTFEQLQESFQKMVEEDEYMQKLYLLRPKLKSRYKFNIQLIIEDLNDYLESQNTFEREQKDQLEMLQGLEDPELRKRAAVLLRKQDEVFGLAVYDSLLQYFTLLLEQKTRFDIRPVHILYEHKKCMSERIAHLAGMQASKTVDAIWESYQEIVKKAEAVWKNMIKFNMTKRDVILVKIMEAIPVIRERETFLLQQLLHEIRVDRC